MKRQIKWERRRKRLFTALILAAFVILSLVSIGRVQATMLRNASIMGEQIVQSFSVNEDANINAYELLLQNASKWLEGELKDGSSQEKIEAWMREYLSYMQERVGAEGIDMYAAIGGELTAAIRWEGEGDFDPHSAGWYLLALEADGEIITTGAYTDVVTGQRVVTLAQKIGETEDVLAIDLFPRYFHQWTAMESLPEGSSFFLCDGTGQLMYWESGMEQTPEEIQAYVSGLLTEAEEREGEVLYRNGLDGIRRAVFHRRTGNGWISIITIPYRYLVNGLDSLALWYAAVFAAFLTLAVVMSVREGRLNRQMALTNETIKVLGNSYFAIYRVNFQKERYTMLKGSDYVRSRIPQEGSYADFMAVIQEIIEPEAYGDFVKSFSIENIRSLVRRKVRDYGGDFLRLFNGEYCWINVRLLFDESLELDEAVLCFREIDEEKRRQLDQFHLLKESLQTMKQNVAAKNLFFANMSHDMRTPLNAIIGMSELAGTHLNEPDRMADYLKKIHGASEHLLGLINDVLEMSRFEQGKLSIESRPFLLKESVEECAEIFRIQAKEQGKTFETRISVQDNHVSGDLFRIQQILNNLLSNAVKFTQRGGRILLSVTQMDSGSYPKYKFVVQDNGAGMSKEFLEKIFIPFERETRFGAKEVTGTGLGMPIVHNIVLQMDGEINVESELGKGSTFTVVLPLAVEEKENAPARSSEPPMEALEEADLSGRQILLAEDNELNMEIAAELLQMQGAVVTKAWNGREAVERFAESAEGFFDVILMDMQMPELDGCEAARAIRALDRSDAASVPIIAVTANAFAEDVAATVAAGMNAHISKPIDFSVLGRTLAKFLSA